MTSDVRAGIVLLHSYRSSADFLNCGFDEYIGSTSGGEHHEYSRLDENRVFLSFFYLIIASILAGLYFTFSSGVNGTNQYGSDPNGRCADIPLEENRLLRALSKLEEDLNDVHLYHIVKDF